ncbi:hypothetical protein PV325_012238, partial [Microctonus aethiopoides]
IPAMREAGEKSRKNTNASKEFTTSLWPRPEATVGSASAAALERGLRRTESLRPDGSYTWTLAETLELLMEEHFPGYKKPEMMQGNGHHSGTAHKNTQGQCGAEIHTKNIGETDGQILEECAASRTSTVPLTICLQGRQVRLIAQDMTSLRIACRTGAYRGPSSTGPSTCYRSGR